MASIVEQDKIYTLRSLTRYTSAIIPVAIYFIAVLIFIKDDHALFDFPLDDAWIHRVYSRSFAFGHGLAYNFGQQEAGSTSPLWSIITAPAHWLEVLGTDAVVFAVKIIGVILGLVSIIAMQRIAYRLSGSRLAAILAASMFGLDPRLLFSTLSGMETCLLVAILTSACLVITYKKPVFFLFLIGLAPTVRPEALVLLPFSFIGLAMVLRADKRIITKAASFCIPFLPVGLWSGFCLWVTGHIFPNTFYLKSLPFSLCTLDLDVGLNAITLNGIAAPWLMLAGFIAFCLFCLRTTDHSIPSFMFFVIAPILYVLSVVGSRRISLVGYYWTRWIDPASLLITMAICMGCSFMLTIVFDKTNKLLDQLKLGRPSRLKIIISLTSLFCIFLSLPSFIVSFSDRRNHLASDSRAIAIMNVQMGRWIRKNTAKSSIVGVNDAGAIRYFGERHTVDLLGLNNANIAFGKIDKMEAIDRTDWLAIFPGWFKRDGTLSKILKEFEPRFEITIPPEEYTICNSTSQTQKIAYQRKNGAKRHRE